MRSVRIANHPDFDSVHANVADDRANLVNYNLRWNHMHGIDAQRVLRGNRGHCCHGMAAKHGHGFDIRLNPRAAAAVGPRDNQNACRRAIGHQDAAALTASQMPSTIRSTCAASSPSAITRITGSVPDGRITKRPLPASSASAFAMTA